MKKILITGAGGYIGSVATYLFLQKGYSVVALDNFSRGFRRPLEVLQKKFGKNKLSIYELDLVKDSLDELFDKNSDIKAVIHYAALCSVDESVKKPELYHKNNVEGSRQLLDSMIKYDVKYIIFSSTCAVYGEAEYVPIDEKHKTKPINAYGESKLKVEQILNKYSQKHGIVYIILRYFNVCGASDDGFVGDSKKPSVHLMQNAVRGALGIEPFYLTCPTVDTADKTPIRDYVNVMDLNEAHLLALKYLVKGGKSTIINLGTGTGNSVLEVVRAVEKVTGAKIKIQKTTPRLGEYSEAIADTKKAEKLLGWKPKRSLKNGAESLVKWYTKHQNGWEV